LDNGEYCQVPIITVPNHASLEGELSKSWTLPAQYAMQHEPAGPRVRAK
jgi:hypothetical protein